MSIPEDHARYEYNPNHPILRVVFRNVRIEMVWMGTDDSRNDLVSLLPYLPGILQAAEQEHAIKLEVRNLDGEIDGLLRDGEAK